MRMPDHVVAGWMPVSSIALPIWDAAARTWGKASATNRIWAGRVHCSAWLRTACSAAYLSAGVGSTAALFAKASRRQAFTNRGRLEREASCLLGYRRDLPELLRIRKRGIGNPETNRRDRDGGRGRVRDGKKSRCSSAAHAEFASLEIAVLSRSRKLVEEVSTKLSCPKIATATYACGVSQRAAP